MTSPQPTPELSVPLVFVIGHGRSGTTWVYDALTSHPQIAGIFESWLITRTNGVVPLFRAHWEGGTLAGKTSVLGRRPGLGQLIARERLRTDVRALLLGWFSEALGPEHRLLVEKGPGEYDVIAELFPEASFVHVVRDGRDVAVSMHDASRSWAPEMKPYIGSGMVGSAELWGKEVRKIRGLPGWSGMRLLELRYERLQADPHSEFRRLFEYCGVDAGDEVVGRVVEATGFKPDEHGFRRQGRTGEWRDRFSALDAFRFDRIAGDQLAALGYVPNRWWWLTHTRRRLRPSGRARRSAARGRRRSD